MITVNMHEAKTRLSALIAMVEEKNEVIRVCRNGKPIARIAAEPGRSRPDRTFRPHLAPLHVKGDLTEPVTAADWPAELKP